MAQQIIIVFLEAMMLYFASRFGRVYLGAVCALNLLLVYTTSQVLSDYHIGISNLGNIFFVTAVTAVIILYVRHGMQDAVNAINMSLFFTMGFMLTRYFAITMNTVNPDDVIPMAYFTSAAYASPVFLGSFCAFFGASYLMLGVFKAMTAPLWIKYILGVLVLELVDSLVFFSVVFTGNHWWAMMQTGFVVKIGLHLIALPFILMLATKERNE